MTRDPIVHSFDALLARRAERVLALSPEDRATVGDVADLCSGIGTTLAEGRLEPATLVALASPNGPAFLAAFLALRRAGFVVLLLDPASPVRELLTTATLLGTRALLTCRTGWPSTRGDWALELLPADGVSPALSGGAVVKLTSGSAGIPRGVLASAESVCADEAALFASMGLSDDDRIVAAIPMGHSYGFSSLVLPALLRGLPLAVPDASGPLAALAVAACAEATFLPTAPAYLQSLLGLSRKPKAPRSLRLVVSAGARLPPSTATAFREAYGQPVHAFYGASECGGICYDRDGSAGERGTVGSPVEGVKVGLEPVPGLPDGEGVVTVRSPAVAERYLPERDARLEGGCFRTSDRGSFGGDELVLLGRLDDLINVKGRKVDPAEVEQVISQLDGVLDVIVVGVSPRLDGSQTVRAVVACRPGLGRDEIVAFCRDRLAAHKVPRSLRIVSSLPRTSRGKIDRRAILGLGDACP